MLAAFGSDIWIIIRFEIVSCYGWLYCFGVYQDLVFSVHISLIKRSKNLNDIITKDSMGFIFVIVVEKSGVFMF